MKYIILSDLCILRRSARNTNQKMIGNLKQLARRWLPHSLLDAIRCMRSTDARSSKTVLKMLHQARGYTVISGAFVGLKYIRRSVGSELTPKLLGTYEKELDVAIREACVGRTAIVDIGAAEGYFAVGLAKLAENAQIIAFESQGRGRRLIADLATLNGVLSRVQIEGSCTPQGLEGVLQRLSRPFILCDCEGGELELMDLSGVPSLRAADILVEVHGRAEVPPKGSEAHPHAMAALLRQRFLATHEIQDIPQVPRTASDWPLGLDEIPVDHRVAAMKESRSPGPGWLWMKSRQHSGTAMARH